MLIEFTVKNFRSIKNECVLSLLASNLVSKDKALDENCIFQPPGGPRLLTSAAIYGANASGKSNVIAALAFMRSYILDSPSTTRAKGGIPVEPFLLSTETENAPSSFEVIFICEGQQYRYGFEVDTEQVHLEWLYELRGPREVRMFERTAAQTSIRPGFREGKGLLERTRPNALLLSVAAQFNGPVAQRIVTWFEDTLKIISGLQDEGLVGVTLDALEDETRRDKVIRFVRNLDVGIQDLRLARFKLSDLPPDLPETVRDVIDALVKQEGADKVEGIWQVETMHDRYDAGSQVVGQIALELARHESEGTRKLFSLAGPLVEILETGKVIMADEFDARLHPIITRALVSLFNSRQGNPRHAQLIFATQDTNLLDNQLLRRDQIWFTEKDRTGATDLYSLAEMKGVRNDASYEKDYIQGRYGGIPFLGDWAQLLGEDESHAKADNC